METNLSNADRQHLRAAEGWFELGDWSSANDELETIQPLHRAHPSVLNLRVQIFAKAGRWENAVLIGPTVALTADAETLLALAICACHLEDAQNGRRWLDQAIALDPSAKFKLRVLDEPALQPIWSGLV